MGLYINPNTGDKDAWLATLGKKLPAAPHTADFANIRSQPGDRRPKDGFKVPVAA